MNYTKLQPALRDKAADDAESAVLRRLVRLNERYRSAFDVKKELAYHYRQRTRDALKKLSREEIASFFRTDQNEKPGEKTSGEDLISEKVMLNSYDSWNRARDNLSEESLRSGRLTPASLSDRAEQIILDTLECLTLIMKRKPSKKVRFYLDLIELTWKGYNQTEIAGKMGLSPTNLHNKRKQWQVSIVRRMNRECWNQETSFGTSS